MSTIQDRELENFKKLGDYWYKRVLTREDQTVSDFSAIEVTKNTVTTSAAKINTPENTGNFYLSHKTASEIVYIGEKGVTALTGFPLEEGESLNLEHFQKDNNNEIYAIGSASATLYCVGVYKS